MPQRIVLTGFMGAGKSTVGLHLAAALGWSFVDLDVEIVRAEQKSIAAIFEEIGESAFRRIEHLTLAQFLHQTNLVLALGGGAVETEANRQLLDESPGTLVVYLQAPLDVLIARCEQQQLQPGAAHRPVLDRRLELTERFLRRKPLYESAHWTVETNNFDPAEIVKRILTQWQQHTASRL